jgi:hypothetical protein
VGLQEVKLAFLRRSIKKPRFWMRANSRSASHLFSRET